MSKRKYTYVPKPDKIKFQGVTIKKDYKGFFVTTHRCRSKSYSSVAKIPKSVIKYIRSTG